MKKIGKIILFLLVLVIFLLLGTYFIYRINLDQNTNTDKVKISFHDLNQTKLFELVEDWRIDNGYQPYLIDERLCKLAEERLPEIKIKFDHSGFITRNKEFFHMEESENIVENAKNEQDALNSWLNSPPHLAGLKRNYTYSCLRTDGSYAVQEFANF